MIWFLYNILFAIGFLVLLPHFLRRMRRRGGYARRFGERVARYEPDVARALSEDSRIWIHAVSVGETYVALRFMEAMRARRPETRWVLSVNTSTARAIAETRVSAPDVLIYFPVDFPFIMRRALNIIRPRALILVECELWPNLVRLARGRGIPVVLVNGRISDHSYRGYRRLRVFTRRLLPQVNLCGMQSEHDAERIQDLGGPAERVQVFGSAKYDLLPPEPAGAGEVAAVLGAAGIGPERPILLGGSTWPGEEAILLDLYVECRKKRSDLFLVLAPRHVERTPEVLEEIAARGLKVIRRSAPPAPGSGAADVFLLDTTGELMKFYSCAAIIFVGKTLLERGGQNIIEPAWWGKPIVVGPHLENFPVVSVDFLEAGAMKQVADAAGLRAAVGDWLADPAAREAVGARAAKLVREKAGAVDRTLDAIGPVIGL